jgi:hypothetical protein
MTTGAIWKQHFEPGNRTRWRRTLISPRRFFGKPRTSCTLDQLRVARSFLKQAGFLAAGVRGFFSADEHGDLVARLAEIEQRLEDEHDFLGRPWGSSTTPSIEPATAFPAPAKIR